MATKKVKRFKEGGVSDKDRGLEASKDDKVSFFERLRMGNIDDEGSEAYRRFGAGRGKAVPIEDRAVTPEKQAETRASEVTVMPIREESKNEAVTTSPEARAQGERQSSGDASVAEMYSGPRTKPILPAKPRVKISPDQDPPAPSKPVKPMTLAGAKKQLNLGKKPSSEDVAKAKAQLGIETSDRNENYGNEGRSRAETSPKVKKPKVKKPYMPEPFDNSYPGSKFKHGGKIKMSTGGSVNKASKRADGIATRGKTRCKIC